MGPCLCGDPYCGRCGNPELAKLEAIQDDFMNKLCDLGLTEEEYDLFFRVGLVAVEASRNVTKKVLADYKADQEYFNATNDDPWFNKDSDWEKYNGEHTDN